jgi:hypothetical protein
MSGGSLYAAMCSDTAGRYAGSGSGIARSHRDRVNTSRPSNVNDAESDSAASSSSRRSAEANVPAGERPLANVISTANAR